MTAPTPPGPDVDSELLARSASLPAADTGDAMLRTGCADSRIQAVWPGARVAGSAFTVQTGEGDDHLHEAMDLARARDVMVVSRRGTTDAVAGAGR